ncbi:MAG TPA: RecQ family ATP-dependent DNA helicase [Gaiellales bacterium]
MSSASPPIDVAAALRRLFGFSEFRPGQQEAIDAVMAGRDVLAVMPTGSGKSLCYQLPALLCDGVTLVVSPLIALMEDQYAALRNRGLEQVEMLTSSMSPDAVAAALGRIADGEARLVYVAPERFSSRRFLDAIGAVGVARLAVDEAHCLSEWGHDFRPDYLRLADVRERLGAPPTIALTATATERVSRVIVAALQLRDPVMPRTGFDRPNLSFAVVPVAGDHAKPAMLARLLEAEGALPAVVYCGRRRTCEEVAEALVAGGIRAEAYHAGLSGDRRSGILGRFLAGDLDAVAATTAFGMGIDKADVRSVVHWALPASPEEYYQQAGRAGRDGLPARCTLLYSPRDKGLIVYFINRAKVDGGVLEAVHRAFARVADPGGVFRMGEREVPCDEPRAAIAALERAGALELFPAPMGIVSGRLADAQLSPRHLGAAMVAGKRVERQRWDRLKAIDGYATSERCRREALLGYFGDRPAEPKPDPCCDRCSGAPVMAAAGAVEVVRRSSGRRVAGAEVDAAILQAVDDTAGEVGRTRLSQILRGSAGRALKKAGHDALASYGLLAGMTDQDVLDRIDHLIGAGTLEKTAGFYPLVRRPAAPKRAASTARDAELRAQIVALGRRGDPEGLPFLTRVLAAADSDDQRRLAAVALGEIGDERARTALTEALSDSAPAVRDAAGAALARL